MKLTIERAALLKAFSHLSRVVERKNNIPILANILIEATTDQVRLKATDLDIEASTSVGAEVTERGATTVPAQIFHDIVKRLPDGAQLSVDQSSDGTQLAIHSGRSQFSLPTLPAVDFPSLETGDFANRFEVDGAMLRQMIECTQFAISHDATRYYLNGIYLHAVNIDGIDVLRAVTTDGHRLSRFDTPAPKGSDSMPGVIVPPKMASEMAKMAGVDETVTVEVSTQKIRASVGHLVITSKLVDGQFPDYNRVIPKDNANTATVKTATLANAVERVTAIASEKSRATKLTLEGDCMTLSLVDSMMGTATEEIDVEYAGEAITIGFNGRYIADALGVINTKKISLKLGDPGMPAIMEPVEGDSLLVVLMPMRV